MQFCKLPISSILGLTAVSGLFLAISARPAAAQVLTLDFSTLGTVYQNTTTGFLYNTAGAGEVDVTSTFELDATTAANILNSDINIPGWSETVNFTLDDLSSESAVADSGINSTDANGRPVSSTIRFDMATAATTPANGVASFLDTTPTDNSEFAMKDESASVGGGTVNVAHFGSAIATTGLSAIGYDALTTDIHELEHSMGYSSGLDRFVSLVGAPNAAANAPDRQLTVPSSLSGLNTFNIPILANSAHIDGTFNNGVYNDSVVAEPGFGVGQRALPSDLELLGLGTIEGATSSQLHLSGSANAPEPSSLFLLLPGAVTLSGMVIRRRKAAVKGA